MRLLLYVFSAFLVMGLAFWAYRENYTTQHQLRELTKVRTQIAHLREDIAMQRAEWAYENRPARLRELAIANFKSLQLLPMEPWQLSDGKEVPYPDPTAPAPTTASAPATTSAPAANARPGPAAAPPAAAPTAAADGKLADAAPATPSAAAAKAAR